MKYLIIVLLVYYVIRGVYKTSFFKLMVKMQYVLIYHLIVNLHILRYVQVITCLEFYLFLLT